MYWEPGELPGIKGDQGFSLKMGIQLNAITSETTGAMGGHWPTP